MSIRGNVLDFSEWFKFVDSENVMVTMILSHTHTHIHMNAHIYSHMRTYMNAHMHTWTHTHANTHTQTHTQVLVGCWMPKEHFPHPIHQPTLSSRGSHSTRKMIISGTAGPSPHIKLRIVLVCCC